MAYYWIMLAPAPTANRDAYTAHAKITAEAFRELGATQVLEGWGDEVPEGKRNSMHTAVLRGADETVVASWVLWPSREVAAAAMEKMESDPRFAHADMPFDMGRMIFGGFVDALGEESA